MEAADISLLYEYIIESCRRFVESFRGLGWEEFTRNREATWNSLHGIFVHILEVEDSWLHYDIPSKPWPFLDREPSAFKNFEEVGVYEQELTKKTRELLANLTPQDLRSEVVFWEGERKSSVENILIHTFIDEVAHLGEFVCLMWQRDVSLPSSIGSSCIRSPMVARQHV